jgi:peptidoglycan/LPS O-acetylase OafA/YrhL
LKYRPEIDGLRAFAVVPVILFHAGFQFFEGGFVGVDVFFVISGYLITTILIDDIENDRFSILTFYQRRARRILPALFFVMLVCIPPAWTWMSADQMEDFAQSLVAVSLFASNFLFWHESGYFEPAAEEKPLLHTWSLAVEEQYYLLFPLFLLVTWRFGRNRVFWIIAVLAALSLMLSEMGWRRNPVANFYLAPTRAWELLAGAMAAFIVQRDGVKANETLSIVGLIAVILSMCLYDKATPVPSVYALVPVLGVVLIVLYAGTETLVARFLGARAFVGVGLISYSAYLWHQPLFAFARIRRSDEPGMALMLALSCLSMALAVISWRYVERPFRAAKGGSALHRSGWFMSATTAMAVMVVGVLGHTQDGFPLKSEAALVDIQFPETFKLETPVFVIGDSHAKHLIPGLDRFATAEIGDMTSPGCIPLRDVDRHDTRFEAGACARIMRGYLDDLSKLDRPSLVVFSTMGPVYLDGTAFKGKDVDRVTGLRVTLTTDGSLEDHYEIFEIGMRRTFSQLAENEHLEVVFVIDIPELGIDGGCMRTPKRMEIFGYSVTDLVDAGDPGTCRIARDDYDARASRYKEMIYRVTAEFPSVEVYDPTDDFCDSDHCYGFLSGYGFLYRDVDHLSDVGSQYVAYNLVNSLMSARDE